MGPFCVGDFVRSITVFVIAIFKILFRLRPNLVSMINDTDRFWILDTRSRYFVYFINGKIDLVSCIRNPAFK